MVGLKRRNLGVSGFFLLKWPGIYSIAQEVSADIPAATIFQKEMPFTYPITFRESFLFIDKRETMFAEKPMIVLERETGKAERGENLLDECCYRSLPTDIDR
uniref:Uncharacterized protein n=1 Tax=Candidatus Kentrum sp. LPFa TaxID=2126335 RepID=A0A450X2Q3_9GAMM|nr:MAG: hypothetical protein BECKLPF1236B_GA0070989_13644 [Candidatus Kentron sp. LPFa]